MTTTEFRAAVLTDIQAKGCIGIDEPLRAQLIRIAERAYVILDERYTGWRMTLDVNPRTDVSNARRFDVDTELMSFGHSPHLIATEFTGYSLSFIANL